MRNGFMNFEDFLKSFIVDINNTINIKNNNGNINYNIDSILAWAANFDQYYKIKIKATLRKMKLYLKDFHKYLVKKAYWLRRRPWR